MEKVKLYNNIYLETKEGLIATDRMKLFIPLKAIEKDGSIGIASFGNQLVDNERGYTFIVDNYVCKQFEKLKVIVEDGVPELFVKDGEEIVNDKTPEQIEIEKLQAELQRKQAELNAKLAPQ